MKLTLQTFGITAAIYGSITLIALGVVVPSLDRATAWTGAQPTTIPLTEYQPMELVIFLIACAVMFGLAKAGQR